MASAPALFREIADLLAARMSFNDPIRVAQIVLGRAPLADPETSTIDPPNNLYRPEMQEFVAMFPRDQAETIADGAGRDEDAARPDAHSHRPARWGRARLQFFLRFRRIRPRSLRYAKESSVHRTLAAHDRSGADKAAGRACWRWCARSVSCPATAPATALRWTNWNLIVNRLAKPVFDGELALPQLPEALARARSAAIADATGEELRRTIADIRATASGAATVAPA